MGDANKLAVLELTDAPKPESVLTSRSYVFAGGEEASQAAVNKEAVAEVNRKFDGIGTTRVDVLPSAVNEVRIPE